MREVSTQKWLLLDRDGTICKKLHYLTDPGQIEIMEGVVLGLNLLKEIGYKFLIITNQSPVGQNIITKSELDNIHEELQNRLVKSGIKIEKIYYCPHVSADKCACRKPEIAMLLAAEKEFYIDKRMSYVIGDAWSDVSAGTKWGAKTVKIGVEDNSLYHTTPVAKDFYQACELIYKNDNFNQ